LGFRALAPFRLFGTVSGTIAIIFSGLTGAQDTIIGDTIIVRDKRRATFLCLSALAPFGLFGAVTGAVAIVFSGLTGAKDTIIGDTI
jgi:hypothetical protein